MRVPPEPRVTNGLHVDEDEEDANSAAAYQL